MEDTNSDQKLHQDPMATFSSYQEPMAFFYAIYVSLNIFYSTFLFFNPRCIILFIRKSSLHFFPISTFFSTNF
jgi:hypothetical protein